MDSTRPWTVAVYLAGGRFLSEPMVRVLQELREVTASRPDRFRALAQFEREEKLPRLFAFDDMVASRVLECLPAPPKRVVSPSMLSSHEIVLGADGRGDASQPAQPEVTRLRRFVETARSVAASEPLCLVFSGHGNGAVGEFLGCRETEHELSLSDFPATFAGSTVSDRKIDVIGMDCCNMSMVEVAFELAPHARFLVASEGEVPSHGWPYRQILQDLDRCEPEEAARRIAGECVGFFSDYGLLDVPSHFAVCRLDRTMNLARSIRSLSEVLLSRIQDPAVWRPVVLAHWEAQSYKNEEYVDLADFCERLLGITDDDAIRDRCAAVIAATEDAVALSVNSGAAFQYSTGLSIYFPWCNDLVKSTGESRRVSVLEKYKELPFNRETLWGEFLDACLLATRREPRAAGVRRPFDQRVPAAV